MKNKFGKWFEGVVKANLQ